MIKAILFRIALNIARRMVGGSGVDPVVAQRDIQAFHADMENRIRTGRLRFPRDKK